MTSAIGKRRTCSGFTLLELVMFVLIVALIVGFLIPAIGGSSGGEDLRQSAGQLEKMARQARTESLHTSRPVRIIFHQTGLELHSGKAPAEDIREDAVEGQPDYLWPKGLTVKIRAWPSSEWIEPEDWAWVFQPSGLTPPLQVRFSSGEYWIESQYNPLTAEVQEERFNLP